MSAVFLLLAGMLGIIIIAVFIAIIVALVAAIAGSGELDS